MDKNRIRQAIIAAGVLIGLPATLLLWETFIARHSTPSPASTFLDEGERQLATGHYVEAISAFTHARELIPNDARVQRDIMKARAYLVAEQPARITAETVEDLKFEAQYLLKSDRRHAAIYLTELGNIAARLNDAAQARAKFEDALKADPSSPVAHTALGVFLIGQESVEDHKQAKAEFEATLKANPSSPVALVGLAQLALGEGKLQEAEDLLTKALVVREDFTARMLLGNAKIRGKQPDKALAQFQRATQLVPNSADAWRSLGEAFMANNKLPEAERALRAAAQLQQDAQTVLALGFTLQREKKSEQALNLFNAVLQQEAGAVPALYGAANALEDLGKKSDALNIYKKLEQMEIPKTGDTTTLAALKYQSAARAAAIEGRPPPAPPQPAAPPMEIPGATIKPLDGPPPGFK